MKDGSKSRRKRIEKISFEEVMDAAGMSGFGALVQLSAGTSADLPHCEPSAADQTRRVDDWPQLGETLQEFSRKMDILEERLGRQNEVIRSLTELQVRRVRALQQACGILSFIACADSTCQSSSPPGPHWKTASGIVLTLARIAARQILPKPMPQANPYMEHGLRPRRVRLSNSLGLISERR